VTDNQLGDAPIEAEYIEQMQFIAKLLDRLFNGETRGDERDTGFVLLVFPFGEKEGRCNYISNGADRDDVVKLFQEQAKRFKGQA
jgi:hypothetical protein